MQDATQQLAAERQATTLSGLLASFSYQVSYSLQIP